MIDKPQLGSSLRHLAKSISFDDLTTKLPPIRIGQIIHALMAAGLAPELAARPWLTFDALRAIVMREDRRVVLHPALVDHLALSVSSSLLEPLCVVDTHDGPHPHSTTSSPRIVRVRPAAGSGSPTIFALDDAGTVFLHGLRVPAFCAYGWDEVAVPTAAAPAGCDCSQTKDVFIGPMSGWTKVCVKCGKEVK